jgi:hypothetical protein
MKTMHLAVLAALGWGALFGYSRVPFGGVLLVGASIAGGYLWWARDDLKGAVDRVYGLNARLTIARWGAWVGPVAIYGCLVAMVVAIECMTYWPIRLLRH